MIRYNSQRQLTLEGFETPFEMNLDPSNRWVKYANELPWDYLVKVYCRKMSPKMGAGAKDPRVVIGALFIKHYGMDLIKARTDITSQSWIGASNFIANFMNFMAEVLFVLIRKRLRRAQNLFCGPFMPSRLVLMPTSRSLNLQVVERGPCTSCSITQNIGLFQ